MEVPGCPLCEAVDARVVRLGQDDWVPDGSATGLRFSVLRCTRCGGHYTSPRFTETSKILAFAGAYPFYERAKRNSAPPSSAEMRAFARRVQAVVRTHPVPGRVLDIGMGDGAFLASMKKQGWAVAGIDIEPSVVDYARTQLSLTDCWVADVERDPLPPGLFDAITLWGMLQLSYRPQALLERIRPALAPGGVLAIGLSNFASAGAALFGSKWRGLGLPRHLVHHDPHSLRSLVERSGYRVLDVSFETPAWIVNGSMDAALPIPGLLGRILRYSVRTAFRGVGRSRWGDTLTLVAEHADR